MDIEYYKRDLLGIEKRLAKRVAQQVPAREALAEPPQEWGDLPVADVLTDQLMEGPEAERTATL